MLDSDTLCIRRILRQFTAVPSNILDMGDLSLQSYRKKSKLKTLIRVRDGLNMEPFHAKGWGESCRGLQDVVGLC